MTGLRSIRPLGPESLQQIEAAKIGKGRPKFEWVDPRILYVEEAYQREVRSNGIKLIRRIYAGFSWARFKSPVCVRLPESGNVLVCIDGQHTATAAATHPDVDKIPVMIVDADDVAGRAMAFVGHNKDRLGLTQMAIYHAELAAGDELAGTINRALRAAGAEIITKPINLRSSTEPGKTIAVGTIRAIAKRQGEEFLARVLKILVLAGRGPMKADEIAGVAILVNAFDDKRNIDDRLRTVVASRSAEAWAAVGARAAADTRQPLPSALAAAWGRALGYEAPRSSINSAGQKGAATRLMESPSSLQAPAKAPEPAVAAQPLPKPAPVRQPAPPTLPRAPAPPPAPVILDKAAAQIRVVERNGIKLDLLTRELTHRGMTIRVHRDDGVKLVAALARVMPAMLDKDNLARKAFGAGRGAELLTELIQDLNPVLRRAQLEVRPVGRIGNMLADLGAGEN